MTGVSASEATGSPPVAGGGLPRVLVVSATRLGQQSATGTAMSSLFAGWPKDRIAQVHADHYSEWDTSVCERYFGLRSPVDRVAGVPVVGRRIAGRFGVNGRWVPWVNDSEALAWARAWDPGVVYLRLVDVPACFRGLQRRFSRELGVPVVTHTMDDWAARFARGASAGAGARLQAELSAIYSGAAANLSISERMAEDFGSRYGVGFETFHNAIDAEEWRGVERRRSVETDGRFRVVYSGGLAEDMCLRSAVEFASVVSKLHGEGVPIAWEVYTPKWWRRSFRRWLRHEAGVVDGGFLPRREYLQSLADADLLVLPVNFDERSLSYVRYSMSNKAPEYMAARAPVLAYGPRESATIGYAAEAGWARVVDRQDPALLESALRELIASPGERARLAEAAHRVGRERHDASANRSRFRAVLTRAALSGRR